MADHKNCKYYDVCDYRNDVGKCPDRCVQYKHKDDVRVVRCKDCKHRENLLGEMCCPYYEDLPVEDNHFCAYGEREDNERKAD